MCSLISAITALVVLLYRNTLHWCWWSVLCGDIDDAFGGFSLEIIRGRSAVIGPHWAERRQFQAGALDMLGINITSVYRIAVCRDFQDGVETDLLIGEHWMRISHNWVWLCLLKMFHWRIGIETTPATRFNDHLTTLSSRMFILFIMWL